MSQSLLTRFKIALIVSWKYAAPGWDLTLAGTIMVRVYLGLGIIRWSGGKQLENIAQDAE